MQRLFTLTALILSAAVSLVAQAADFTYTIIPVSDCHATDAGIIVTSDAAFDVQYGLARLPGTATIWQTGSTFTNLTPGNYRAYVRRADNYKEIDNSGVLTIETLTAPQINSVSFVDVGCTPGTGSITINATGGSGSFEYSINGVSYQSGNFFTGLSGGTYTVHVRNAGGTCEVYYTTPITLTDTPVVELEVTATNVTDCDTNDGSIIIDAGDMTDAVEYSIDGGSTWSSNNQYVGLTGGTYAVQGRLLGKGCVVDYGEVTIYAPTAPIIHAVSFTQPTACGLDDGTIIIEAAGGTGPLEYSINGNTFITSGTFTNLPSGTYTISVRNANNSCAMYYATPITLDNSAPVNVAISSTNVTACDATDGSIHVSMDNTSQGFQVSIDGSQTWSANHTFTNLETGAYDVWVRNTDGTCLTHFGNVTIGGDTTPFIWSVVTTDVSGCDNPDGSIHIDATGSSSLNYSIDGFTYQSSGTFTGLAAGDYQLQVRNANGSCVAHYATPLTISAPEPAQITSVNTTNATTDAGGSISVQVAGDGLYQYHLSGTGATVTNTTGAFVDLATGSYQLSVSLPNGSCTVYYVTDLVIVGPVVVALPSLPMLGKKTMASDLDPLLPLQLPSPDRDIATQGTFVAFPNPTAGRLEIRTNVTEAVLVLTDVSGRELRRQPVQSGDQLRLESLPAGTYLVRLYDGAGYMMGHQRIVKQ